MQFKTAQRGYLWAVGEVFFENLLVLAFSWNNGLREAVVTDSFLFLSTFFIQVLCTY
jgi:hypothetical protein